jgi:hypothetical protein
MNDRHDLIRRRAFEIWERDGAPGDKPEDHWLRAEREIDQADMAMSGSKPNQPMKTETGARTGPPVNLVSEVLDGEATKAVMKADHVAREDVETTLRDMKDKLDTK